MKRHPPKRYQVHTVEVEHNGKLHQAEYTVENGVVIVRYYKATNQALAPNPSAHLIEAKNLLLEILEANNWKF